VEGVQSQTRRLARAVRAAGLPLIVFVNKIDRLGARGEALLEDLRRKLNLRVVVMNAPAGLGTRQEAVVPHDRAEGAWREALIDLLAETDERVIAEFERSGGEPDARFLDSVLREQIAGGTVAPVYFGSAITGVGVAELLAGVREWLPPAADARDSPLDGTIFKIVRRPSGEKVVYARLFAGTLAARQRVMLRRLDALGEAEPREERVTAIDRFAGGPETTAGPGEVVALHGVRSARIGDHLGAGGGCRPPSAAAFPAPALESVVRPLAGAQITRLRAALEQLAEQDPLISLRQRNEEGEVSVRLYGEVQKEILTETLAQEFGVGVWFGPTRTVCIERPLGMGERAEIIGEGDNPFYGTVGFRVEPGERGGGIRYERELGALPPAFYRAIEETVYEALGQGLHGWEVTDCLVTLTHAGFWSPVSTAGDFRKLVPLVLLEALRQAGTEVCEPIDELELEIPEDTFGAVCGVLLGARATIRNAERAGESQHLVCEIPTAELRGVEHQLPGLTRGEAGWESRFFGYVPVSGEPPVRKRIGPNPLNRAQYLGEVARG
jgi:ribosomal protection tetracycline resistance protein